MIINGNKWFQKWQNCVDKASYRWPQQSLHFREGYAPSPQYAWHFLGSNRSMSPRLLNLTVWSGNIKWSVFKVPAVRRVYQTNFGGSLGSFVWQIHVPRGVSKDFRFATANSRSLRGWIVEITRQCTASSDATMVSGHETWLIVSLGAEDEGHLCPRTFRSIVIWNGHTRGLPMKRQPEQFFLLFGWRTSSASVVFWGSPCSKKPFLYLGISGIQVLFPAEYSGLYIRPEILYRSL